MREICEVSLLTLIQYYNDSIVDQDNSDLQASKNFLSFLTTSNYVSKKKIEEQLKDLKEKEDNSMGKGIVDYEELYKFMIKDELRVKRL